MREDRAIEYIGTGADSSGLRNAAHDRPVNATPHQAEVSPKEGPIRSARATFTPGAL